MTQTSNRLFDEFAKFMTDAAGAAQGLRKEAETVFRGQAERWLAEMDVVQREEFEAVKAMAVKAREENEHLAARIQSLESALAEIKVRCSGVLQPGELDPASPDPASPDPAS